MDLASVVSPESLLEPQGRFLTDLMGRGVVGTADAVVLPSSVDEVAAVMRWCYEHDVPLTARGGGTGLAGGAVPVQGGVVIGFDRLNRVRQFDPLLWRMHVEAGVTTGDVQRLARESGLRFPPDPGAAEVSQIGGNVACNAGGPHAFKYGVTRQWVTGLEVVVPPGEIVRLGGPLRKDVAAYDLTGLFVGSEGTLGLVTAAWLRLIPAPELELPVIGLYRDVDAGVAAIERVLGSGVVPAALEYLDGQTLGYAGDGYPFGLPAGTGFMVVTEADGSPDEARRVAAELADALAEDAVAVHAPADPAEVADLWRWRGGVAFAFVAQRGGAFSEDVSVPVDRLREVARGTLAIGERHGVPALSFGHAGDGNIHSTFLFSPDDADEEARADAACRDIFALALELGGSVSGEHGIGWLKRGQLERQLGPVGYDLHTRIKQAFDPKGLLNPGKKR
ncbi:MAG TPA: FAD-linked oxidase C-terminal domain-containing protein [Gaiellaceae bacterium]|jgi:glycolate oxidase subunit GlcD|nr:FAD-linked oxidase C-terminal domain-containing protein [Gaiellaceae bacterium]